LQEAPVGDVIGLFENGPGPGPQTAEELETIMPVVVEQAFAGEL